MKNDNFFLLFFNKNFYNKLIVFSILFLIFFFVVLLLLYFIFSNEYIEVSGYTRPLECQIIAPKVAGVVKEVYVSNGDFVKKGELLLELEDESLLNKRESLKIQINECEFLIQHYNKLLDVISKKYANTKEINDIEKEKKKLEFNKGFASQSEYLIFIKNKTLELLSVEKEYLSIENEAFKNKIQMELLENNKNDLEYQIKNSKIYSLIDGIVVLNENKILKDRILETGNQNSYISPLSDIYAEVLIPDIYMAQIEKGQKVKLFLNALPHYKYKVFEGELMDLRLNNNSMESNYIGTVKIKDPFFLYKKIDETVIKKIIFGLSLKARIYIGKQNLFYNIVNF